MKTSKKTKTKLKTKNKLLAPEINKGGSPKVKFSYEQWHQFEKLCSIQCTKNEIADWFRICPNTLDRVIIEKYGKSYSEVYDQLRNIGKISLRRKQWQLADTNPSMAKFLGINYLGQVERQEIQYSGSIEQRINSMTIDERLKRLEDLQVKLNSVLKDVKC